MPNYHAPPEVTPVPVCKYTKFATAARTGLTNAPANDPGWRSASEATFGQWPFASAALGSLDNPWTPVQKIG